MNPSINTLMPGPQLRTDIIEAYLFRRPNPASGRGVEFLQLRRSKEAMTQTWQPVMGHVEQGETAAQAALREIKEETNLRPIAFWQLEAVNTFYMAASDAVMLCPGFAAEVAAGSEPTLDDSHDAHRWVTRDHADRAFLWPGQRRAVEAVIRDILEPGSPLADLLRLPL